MKYTNRGCQPHTVKVFCAELKNLRPSITKRATINCSHHFSSDRLHQSLIALDTLNWRSCTNDLLGRKLQANKMYPCAEKQNNCVFVTRWAGNCRIYNVQQRRTPVTFQFVDEQCIKVNLLEGRINKNSEEPAVWMTSFTVVKWQPIKLNKSICNFKCLTMD